jgi:SNF2 family DNA or RNA helicase
VDYTLYKHQIAGIERAKQGNLCLFWDCGTGKSLATIKVIEYWKEQGQVPALVVAPLATLESVWVEDTKKFSILSVCNLRALSNGARRMALQSKGTDVFLCNYDLFKSMFQQLSERCFSVLVIDESSKMKCHTTGVTRSILAMAGISYSDRKGGKKYHSDWIIPHRYVLSGTPAPNNELEYWPQTTFITGPGNVIFSDSFFAFRNQYFYGKSVSRVNPFAKIWRIRDQKSFLNAMAPVSDVVRKEDALDLPEQVVCIRDVELSDDELGAYHEMEDELVLEFADEDVAASTVLAEIAKLRQITGGFCYGAEGTHQIGRSKIDELVELLGEIGQHQVIIWCNFKAEAKAVSDALGASAVMMTADNREDVINKFHDGTIQYLIANPQSAGHGLTFTNCSYAVYFSPTYSYELLKQSMDRIHRIGQKNNCTYYHLIAKGTIDELVYKAVTKKEDLSRTILAYLKECKDANSGKQGTGQDNQVAQVEESLSR